MNALYVNRLLQKLAVLELTAQSQLEVTDSFSMDIEKEYIETVETLDLMIAAEWGDVLDQYQSIH